MKSLIANIIILSSVILSSKADYKKTYFEPHSITCRKFETAKIFDIQKCEMPNWWGRSFYCKYKCDITGELKLNDCRLNSSNVDYPLCHDLYCAAKTQIEENNDATTQSPILVQEKISITTKLSSIKEQNNAAR